MSEEKVDGAVGDCGPHERHKQIAAASKEADPFINDLDIAPWDWFKLALGTVLILPWRAPLVLLLIVLAWLVCKIGMIGLDEEELVRRPLSGWRRKVFNFYSYFGKVLLISHLVASMSFCDSGGAVLYAGGFHLEVLGERAPRSSASLLIGAPHSSFLEALVLVFYGCSPVSRAENKDAILIATCQKFAHTIFVER